MGSARKPRRASTRESESEGKTEETMASGSASDVPKWQSELKSSFKKFKKTMSTENIKQKLMRRPSKEKIVAAAEKQMQENVPPVALPQTALKNKTPEPKAPHPKSPLAAVEAMKSTPFNSPRKTKIDVTKSPSPPVVAKGAEPTAPPMPTADATAAKPSKSDKRATLLNCTRVAGVAVALFAIKAALGARKSARQ